jgi:hypothetical protein
MRLGGPVARRVIAVLALLGMLVMAAASVASMGQAQVPDLPLPLPGGNGEPPPEEPDQPTDAPPTEDEDAPETEEPQVAPPEETMWPMPMPTDGMAPMAPAGEPTAQAPQLPAPRASDTGAVRPAVTLDGVSPVAAALPGAFGISLAGLLAVTGVAQGVLALAKRGLFAARTDDGGIDVEATKRWRLLGGLGLLAAAAVVGVVGYLKISLETQVAVQIVYLASAGFAVLVLAVAGGALLVAEQLRADERRLREVEDALVNLAGQVQPLVSEPPRVIARGKAGKRFDPDITTEIR